MAVNELLEQHAAFCRVTAEGSLWPRGDGRNDWAYDYMPKRPDGRGWWALSEETIKAGGGRILLRYERARAGTIGESYPCRPESARLACRLRDFSGRNQRVLARPGITAEQQAKIDTTVYRLPGAGFSEKPGTMVNSSRLLQWRDAATPPLGDARIDLEILAQIFVRVRKLYKTEGGAFPDPILNLTWDYEDRSARAPKNSLKN